MNEQGFADAVALVARSPAGIVAKSVVGDGGGVP